MAPDRLHLHHRLLSIGHSYRQSVLIMYLWAALFSVTVVSLSVVRTRLVVLEAATIIAVLALLPVTMPRLRPWHSAPARRPVSAPAHARAEAARAGRSPRDAPPLPPRARTQGPALASPVLSSGTGPQGPALNGPPPSVVAPPPGPVFHAAPTAAGPAPVTPAPLTPGFPGEAPWFTSGGYPVHAPPVPGEPLPRAGRLPSAEPPPYPADPQDPFGSSGWRPSPGYLPADGSFSGPGPLAGPLADGGEPDVLDPLPQAQQRDLRPWWGRDLDFSLPLFTLPLPSPARDPVRQAPGLHGRDPVARWS